MTADSVPAPMVQVPADKLEALREAVANYRTATVARFQMGQTAEPMTEIELAAGAFVDAATPAASVPAADILAGLWELADQWDASAKNGARRASQQTDPGKRTHYADLSENYEYFASKLRATLVAAAEQADKGEAADTPRDEYDAHLGTTIAPAAPVGEPPPEGWRHIPWTSKEDGVGAPETPASGESGPPAPPALCVGCGHDVGLHNEKGFLHGWAGPEGLCRCRLDGSQAPRVPVNDEAEAEPPAMVFLTDEERDYLAFHGVNLHTPPCEQCSEAQAAIESVMAARLAGFRAARGENA